MKFLSGLFNVLSGFIMFFMLFLFIKWYIKGHFDKKWFWAFWAFTIFTIINYNTHHNPPPGFESDPRSGQEIWNENMKNYDAQRGY